MQTLLSDALSRMAFGEAQSHGALTVLPIMADLPAGPEYLTLGEALAAGTLVITEVSDGGSVPELAVANTGGLPVLLLDGEELAGAKQNRVVNTTILLKAQTKTVIPVSCVEQGRWHYASREFRDSGNVMSADLRARKGRSVSASLARSGSRASDQGEVWAGVEAMACSFQVASDTGAMRDVYAHVEQDLAALLQAFAPMPGQRGFAACIGGRVVGLEFISCPRAFAGVFEKLLRSYALDALAPGKEEPAGNAEEARQFVASVAQCAVQTYDALGHGREHRIASARAHGSALTVDDSLIHLSLLADAPARGKDGGDVPFPRSYWVQSGRLLAGCYPGAPGPREAERKLQGLVDAGIRAVISLMEPEETDYAGRPFTPYEPHLQLLASAYSARLTCLRLPVADHCVPTRAVMREILDAIDACLAEGMPIYIHCWGGKGRTGTVVGCWLARHGLAIGDDALRMVQHLRRNDPTADQPSPENKLQRAMVRSWREGE